MKMSMKKSGLLDPVLLPIAALALGATRGDVSAGGKVGTEGYQRSQEMQYVVGAVEWHQTAQEVQAEDQP
jgi:hypothetical protein